MVIIEVLIATSFKYADEAKDNGCDRGGGKATASC
jgi:hypothetical protein